MKNALLMFAVLAWLGSANLFSADTPELDRLTKSYKAAIEKATAPLHQTYLAELNKLRDSYTRAANLEGANKVQAEINLFSSSLQAPPAPSPPTVAAGQEFIAVIPANEVNGYKLGPLKKGATITLSYVTGRWKDHGKLPTDNPDAEFTENGDATRLVISHGRYQTKPGPVLTKVPPGTSKTPYSFTVAGDLDNVVLRINKDESDYKENPGAVHYKVKVTH